MNVSKGFYKKIVLTSIYLVLFFYNIHRYVFQYGDPLTSPTYTATPLIWKISKYLILTFLVLLYYVLVSFKFQFHKFLLFYSFVLINILSTNFFWIFFQYELVFDELEYLYWATLLLPFFFISSVDLAFIRYCFYRLLNFFFYFLIAGNILVIFNYLLFGRIPGLSFEGLIIRFGGIWDDPNGFGFFCSFLLFHFLTRKHWFKSIFLAINIFLTISFSAFSLMIMAISLWGISLQRGIRLKLLKTVSFFVLFVSLAVIYFWDTLISLYEFKSASVKEHSTFTNEILLFPFLEKSFIKHETWYYSFFYNYLPFSFISIILIFIFFINIIFSKKNIVNKSYLILFLFGCIFIPMFQVFPINFLFFIFLPLFVKKNTLVDFEELVRHN